MLAKKQNNVLKQRIVNSYLGQKSNAVESDSRFRTGGKPEQMTNVYANNNEIWPLLEINFTNRAFENFY